MGFFSSVGGTQGLGKKKLFYMDPKCTIFFQATRAEKKKGENLWFGLVEMRQPLKYENVENSASF